MKRCSAILLCFAVQLLASKPRTSAEISQWLLKELGIRDQHWFDALSEVRLCAKRICEIALAGAVTVAAAAAEEAAKTRLGGDPEKQNQDFYESSENGNISKNLEKIGKKP